MDGRVLTRKERYLLSQIYPGIGNAGCRFDISAAENFMSSQTFTKVEADARTANHLCIFKDFFVVWSKNSHSIGLFGITDDTSSWVLLGQYSTANKAVPSLEEQRQEAFGRWRFFWPAAVMLLAGAWLAFPLLLANHHGYAIWEPAGVLLLLLGLLSSGSSLYERTMLSR